MLCTCDLKMVVPSNVDVIRVFQTFYPLIKRNLHLSMGRMVRLWSPVVSKAEQSIGLSLKGL